MTTKPAHQNLPYLDGWRGVAVLLVLLGHFAPLPGFNTGRLGVELFFVLSGRLMSEVLFIRGTLLPDFYRRRFSRIFPALFVFVAAYTVFNYFAHGTETNTNATLAAILFYTNYLSALGVQNIPSLEHTWSLAIEEHAYVLLSLILLLCSRRAKHAGILIGVLAVGAILNAGYQTYALSSGYYEVFWRSDVRMASILMSAALSIHFHYRPQHRSQASLVLILALGTALNFNAVPDIIKYSIGTLCFAYTVNLAANLPTWTLNILTNRILVTFGLASYSIYLWQQPFYKAIDGMASRPLLLAIALVCGFASYRYVETPMRRWINGLGFRKYYGSAREVA